MTEPAFITDARATYDTIAADYAAGFGRELDGKPLDRGLLTAFADEVRAAGGPVADVGCGPGHVTAHLHALGVTAFGVDLSPNMVEVARRSYPYLRFEVGTMTALPLDDASLGGIAAMYSIIHIPDAELPTVFAEFARVLRPGGTVLLAFQEGDEHRRVEQSLGHAIGVDFHRRTPAAVSALLRDAGLTTRATLIRAPYPAEGDPRAYVLAVKASEN